jgi:hypothetical protein
LSVRPQINRCQKQVGLRAAKMKTASLRWIGRVRNYSRALATIPSLVFGVVYLASIPAFAALYATIPPEFYSATARHEYFLSDDAALILSDVRAAIEANFQAAYGSIHKEFGSWNVNITAFGVEWPSIVPEELRLVVRASAQDMTPPAHDSVFTFQIDLSGMPLGPRNDGPAHSTYLNVVREFPVAGIDPAVLFPCRNHEANTCLSIPFGSAADLRLDRARAALLGLSYPYWRGGHFLRMLYFSAVTISTPGYGDIVPISTRARTMVTVEAIWGPVLLGLFLNSLITEAAHARPKHADRAPGKTNAV